LPIGFYFPPPRTLKLYTLSLHDALPIYWARAIQVASSTLAETSKDLLVAARLTEALTRKHGFPGLRDGLTLLKRLCEECWDRLYPEEEYRGNQVAWLNDGKRSSRLPWFVALTPLVQVDGESFHLFDWQDE